MADQYDRARDALAARFPGARWDRVRLQIHGRLDPVSERGSIVPLRFWISRRTPKPGGGTWRVDADLGSRRAFAVRFESPDVVDAVGVVLRCLVASAREEGWTKIADELAAVEAAP